VKEMLATKLKVASALFLSSFIVWLILVLLFAQPTDSVGKLQFSNFTFLALFLGSAIAASISSMSIGLDLLEVKVKPVGIAQKFKRGRVKLHTRKSMPVLRKRKKKSSTKRLRKSQISQPVLNAAAPSSEEEVILPDASLSIDEKVVIKNLEISGDHEEDVVQVEPRMLSQPSTNAILKKPTVEKEKTDEVSVKESDVDTKGISCPECSKVFKIAMVTLDYSSGTAKMVKLCPYCNSVITSSGGNETALASCPHWFGYLNQKDVVTIPDECLDCKRVMECMLKEDYSTKAVDEIKKWMH